MRVTDVQRFWCVCVFVLLYFSMDNWTILNGTRYIIRYFCVFFLFVGKIKWYHAILAKYKNHHVSIMFIFSYCFQEHQNTRLAYIRWFFTFEPLIDSRILIIYSFSNESIRFWCFRSFFDKLYGKLMWFLRCVLT